MIRHTVVFKLNCVQGSAEETAFLKAASMLAAIPTVQNFEALRQVSSKNDFEFGFSMEFDSVEGYKTYNDHPAHTDFVETYWKVWVEKFLEIDYEPLSIAGL